MKQTTISRMVLLALTAGISILFFQMTAKFLMAIFLAGIFTALVHPLYRRLVAWFRGREALAALTTIVLIVALGVAPLSAFLGVVTAQAVKIGQQATPAMQKSFANPAFLAEHLGALPYYEQLRPYHQQIVEKAEQLVGVVSATILNYLQSATLATVHFVVMLLVMLYAMFFFLMDGEKLLVKILYYLPLEDRDEQRMIDRFTSVSRATLKGSAVIGILQGGVAGMAFAAAGIEGAAFWGTVMTLMSVLPGIGTAIVWLPASVILALQGQYWTALGLLLFCGIVVSGIDSILRPRMVGKDTKLHELMIFLSTIGGITFFGILGFIIGPIIAALFVTLWEIYGEVFADFLPQVDRVAFVHDLHAAGRLKEKNTGREGDDGQ